MSTHTVVPSIFYSGVWNDVPADVLEGDQVKVTRGFAEDGTIRPSSIEWRFNNATDAYRPTNPTSPLYGLAGRSMPSRVTVDGSVRAVCEATSYKPDQTEGFTVGPPARGLRWVDFVAQGQLARIGAWEDPLRSAIYQHHIQYANLRGYWTLEDGTAATQLTNAIAGGLPGYLIGATPGGAGIGGGGTAMTSTTASRIGGSFTSMSTSAGWQFSFSAKLATTPSATLQPYIQWTTSNGLSWSWDVSNANFRMKITESDGSTVLDSSASMGAGVDPTQWNTFRFKISAVAGTVSVEAAWYPQDALVVYGYTPTYVGTVGRLTTWKQNGNANTNGALYAHVFGLTGVSDNLQFTNVLAAYNGYLNEPAGDRFTRLCAQLGITSTFVGTSAATWPMGRQKPATMIDTLKEIQATEDGLIFDTPGSLGLTMRARATLYNQTAKMTLVYPGDIAAPLREVVDTYGVANYVSVNQRNGGTALATLATGALSTQAPPAGIGTKKASIDVNVGAESTLPVLAGWHLSSSTIDAPRYPQVVIDLDDDPSLSAGVNTVGEGDLIILTGRAPEPIKLIVLGIEDVVRQKRRKVTFTCVPADVYAMGVYDAASSRYDVLGSTLAGAQTTTSTAWTVTAATADDVWSTTATPYEWQVAGERVRVTAMNAATGTGPYSQTCTVVRSVNGVVKAQAAAASVHMSDRTVATAGRVRYAI